ncbi:MAG: endonuclease [Clostridia bacterium]|nr:endonuclease [Clostridia bacterium]
MKKFVKVLAPLLMIAVLCTTLLSGLSFSASAASYVYNWGEREELATSLSQMAIDWYEDEGTGYDELSQLSGSSSISSVPSSKLYEELQSLMKGAHSYITSYSATKSMYQYTDCENGGGKISSFYSGKAVGPTWDGSFNREHTWPNSKGLGGNDENDVMMLRPTSYSENTSRGNTAYGEGSSYYHPNEESGGKHDLRGDVARICLYVYVRWGNTRNMWGTSGVMESKDVLIEWMEEDPVDTWELGRNDSVQSITGTRNVFVDYPELAFLLFAEDIPVNYQSPSGEGANGGGTPIVTTTTTTTSTTKDQGGNVTTTTTKGQGGNVTTTKGQGGTTTTKGQGGATTTTEQLSQEDAGNTTAGTQFRPGMAMGGTSSTTATTTTTAAESNADPDPLLDTTQWLIIAGAAVVIIGAVIVIVLVTRKKEE